MGFLFIWLFGDITNLSGMLLHLSSFANFRDVSASSFQRAHPPTCLSLKHSADENATLPGALWANLAPTAIALAFYFCIADFVLIAQCLYYNTVNARRRARAQNRHRRRHTSTESQRTEDSEATAVSGATEDEPLLQRSRSGSAGLPGSHRRPSRRQSESNLDPLTRIITGEDETRTATRGCTIPSVWWQSGSWVPSGGSSASRWERGILKLAPRLTTTWQRPSLRHISESRWGTSAPYAIYGESSYLPGPIQLGSRPRANLVSSARIPQIIKNYRQKSCEGLALLFFLLSLTGNFTYGASVISYSQEPDYLLKAIPWLLGSLGTIVEDMVIFAQFRLYSTERKAANSATACAS